jgi:hypothetical protein
MRATTILLSFLLAPSMLVAQDWAPIPPEQLSLSQAPNGLHLNALLLYRSLAVDDEKKTSEEHMRIKILKEDGRDRANVEIPFIKGLMEISDLRARTVQPDGKVTPFEGIVYEKTLMRTQKFRYLVKTFALPDVRVGSILEYRYMIKRKEIAASEWRLQSSLFTLHARFSIKPPKFEGAFVDFPVLRWTPLNVKQDLRPNTNPDGSVSLELNNIPAFEAEDFALPEQELMPRFEFYYLSIRMSVESYWAELLKAWSHDVESFLGKPRELQEAATSIVGASDSDEQKLRKIYTRVQRLRNLSHEVGRTSQQSKREDLKQNKNAQEVWRRGYGSGRDIDLLFVALARAAGFDSDFVEYVGRNRGLFHRDLPDARQFTGFVAMVALKKPGGGTEAFFADPAVPALRYGMLDWDSTGVAAVRLHGQGGDFITIGNRPEWGGMVLRKGILDLDSSGKLSGTVVVSFNGQEALWRRKQARELDLDETRKREDLEDDVKSWVPNTARVSLLKMGGWDETGESLTAEFSLEIPDFASSTPSRLIASTTVFRTHRLLRDAMQHATRLHAFYFPYTWQEEDDISIRLPAGVEVEELPAHSTFEVGLARYRSSCENQASVLRMTRRLEVNGILYPNTGTLRGFFNNVRESDENLALMRRRGTGGR